MRSSTPPVERATIAAIASAPGEAGIAVIRISGNESLAIADRIFRSSGPDASEVPANTFQHGYIHEDEASGAGDIDEAILLVYRAPHSYTREDVVEIQCHGGRVCSQRILRAALNAGARMAEPGEFTRRAFLNGRIDLLQAEAVMDLIRSHSDRAALAAVEQMEGRLSCCFTAIYDDLISAAADVEATLNFDEDELPATVMKGICTRLEKVRSGAEGLLATWEEGRLLREGACVVISGQPNVGKSTLLNALLGSERAIVTPVPGTTRDTIEEEMVVDGIPIRLIDTAGLRDSECIVEREGVQRAHASLAGADLILYVIDASRDLDDQQVAKLRTLPPDRVIVVLNKTDLGNRIDMTALPIAQTVRASLINGQGREAILDRMTAALGVTSSVAPHAVISERHRSVVQSALNELNAALESLTAGQEDLIPLAASRLRYALEELGKATGRTYTNELLDKIFGRFCIGK